MTDITPTLLDINFDDAMDFEVLPDDSEVQVQVVKCEFHRSEKGNISLHLVMDVPESPNVDSIHHYQSCPTQELKDQDEKAYRKRINALKDVYEAFNVSTATNGVDPNDFVGQTAYAIVGMEPGTGGYSDRNTIKKFVASA